MGATDRVVRMPSADMPGASSLEQQQQPMPQAIVPVARRSMRASVAEARRRVADALPAVVEKLAQQATHGDATPMKLFLEVSGVLKGGLAIAARPKKEKSLEEILNEQWERYKPDASEQD